MHIGGTKTDTEHLLYIFAYYTPCNEVAEGIMFTCPSVRPISCHCNSSETTQQNLMKPLDNKDILCSAYRQEITIQIIF